MFKLIMATLYTIGHSNHSLEEFLELLNHYQIGQLVDVRSMPRSRYVPWFNKEKLSNSLKKHKIHYLHLGELGGLRHSKKDSINTGWNNKSFRGYADYMQTPEFFNGLKNLNALLKSGKKVAIMCAEAVPWRCHRSMIGDAEIIRGIKVLDILTTKVIKPHILTSFAVIDRSTKPIRIYYP